MQRCGIFSRTDFLIQICAQLFNEEESVIYNFLNANFVNCQYMQTGLGIKCRLQGEKMQTGDKMQIEGE